MPKCRYIRNGFFFIQRMQSESFITKIERLLADQLVDQATALWQAHSLEHPDTPDTNYGAGLLLLVAGNSEAARDRFLSTAPYFSSFAKLHNNLGKAYLDLGDFVSAINSFKQAINIEPENPRARYNLACASIYGGELDTARELLDLLLVEDAANADYWCASADVYRLNGALKKALREYQKAVALNSEHAPACTNLGALLMIFGSSEEALEFGGKAVELAPRNHLSHLNLGRTYLSLERFDEAMSAFADAFELEPENAVLCACIADVWSLSGDVKEAGSWYSRALALDGGCTEAVAGIARIFLDSDNVPAALEILEEKISEQPYDPILGSVYADALWDDGDITAALAALDKSRQQGAEHPKALVKRGRILASSGDTSGALECYDNALAINPKFVPALYSHTVQQKGATKPEIVERMEGLLTAPNIRDGTRATLHGGLAYFYDGVKDWGNAANHMAKANESQWNHRSKRAWNYDARKQRHHIDCVKRIFNREHFERVGDCGNQSPQPVFILGMPRSGTTLTEQILGRHSQVLGIGERNFLTQSLAGLPNALDKDFNPVELVPQLSCSQIKSISDKYLEKLAALKVRDGHEDTRRIVDKMPDNYSLLGWILTLFPRAKIIHCRRDPRDVALSCWMTQFGKIPWASRMADLCDRIDLYHEVMAHWRSVVSDRFVEIDYEDTIYRNEDTARNLIDWLELEWDEKCLKFYESEHIVRTASVTQVREPIYDRSVGRWHHYSQYIPDLLTISLPDA